MKRKLGPVRKPSTREGLTKRQAEEVLRRKMAEVTTAPPSQRMTVEEAGIAYIDHLELLGRKPSTIQDYSIILNRHLVPAFGGKALDRITADDVRALLTAKLRKGYAHSTIHHVLNLLNGIYGYAIKRGWATINPVTAVDRPPPPQTNPDIRFLDLTEVEALARAVPDDRLGQMERPLYLTAAMTGLRQGELVALRWQDVDWLAGLIRVRRSYTRKQWGTPKSRRSSRAVPMPERIARELEHHFQRSAYQGDDDLVFCHPDTGNPYDASKLRKRFKAAVKRAKVREVTFHQLRHSFATRMAAVGTPLRTLQEFGGWRDPRTAQIYADFAPSEHDAAFAAAAFDVGINPGINLSTSGGNSEQLKPHRDAGAPPSAT